MNLIYKKSIVFGFIWSFVGRISYILIALVSNIILARILSPTEFGQMGIVMFFIVISKVLLESGLGGAIVRSENPTEKDYATVFIFNLIISIFSMLALILFSGNIADFYNDGQLQPIIIHLSFILLINAFQIIQITKLVRDLNFKKKAKYELIAITLAAVVGILLALNNYGVWSMVYMQLLNAFLLTLLLWINSSRLIKKLTFSKTSFKKLYLFGVNTTLASLLSALFDNIYQLILGKYFSINQTGLFYQAKKLQEPPMDIVKSASLGVAFSSLSKFQNDPEKFKSLYNKYITSLSVCIGLISAPMLLYAENIMILLYGNKWIAASLYLQLLTIAGFFYIHEIFVRIVFKVFDKTQKILHLELLKKIIQATTIVIGVLYKSVEILLIGFIITSIASYIMNYVTSIKLYDSFSLKQVKVTMVVFCISITSCTVIYFTEKGLQLTGYYSFLLLPILIFLYLLGVKMFNISDPYADIKELKNIIFKK